MYRAGFVIIFYVVSMIGYSQGKIYETNGIQDDELYPYMLYWKETSNTKTGLNEAVFNLEQGNFKAFDLEKGKNIGLFPESIWFYLNVKNTARGSQTFWWSFFTHADTIIIHIKQKKQWKATDTLVRQKLLRDRKVRHRALTYSTTLNKEQEQSYLAQIINPR